MRNLVESIRGDRPLLLLAPMQDVTDLPFWRILHRYGGPDVYFTEYFRVHSNSRPEKHILHAIDSNPSGKQVIAQMIGHDIPALVKTAKILLEHPLAAIDLNLGCPAPIVCKKLAGGALLKHGHMIRDIVLALRETIPINFTLKTRIGFHDPSEFESLMELYAQLPIDALTVHGRTVKEMYRSEVHHDLIATAVARMPFPVFANGNILGPGSAASCIHQTRAAGLMIGRGCIRNPWIFDQIRSLFDPTLDPPKPTLKDLLAYILELYAETKPPDLPERIHVQKMKKYLNFIAPGINSRGDFHDEIKRANDLDAFRGTIEKHLLHDDPFEPETSAPSLSPTGSPRDDCWNR